MADTYTLADLMRERYARAGQGLGALEHSVPDAGPPGALSQLSAVHEWITRNALEPAQYALFYPPRVLARYMDPSGTDPFWRGSEVTHGQMPGIIAPPRERAMVANVLNDWVGIAPPYVPGERQSDMVEDQRWNPARDSIWKY